MVYSSLHKFSSQYFFVSVFVNTNGTMLAKMHRTRRMPVCLCSGMFFAIFTGFSSYFLFSVYLSPVSKTLHGDFFFAYFVYIRDRKARWAHRFMQNLPHGRKKFQISPTTAYIKKRGLYFPKWSSDISRSEQFIFLIRQAELWVRVLSGIPLILLNNWNWNRHLK